MHDQEAEQNGNGKRKVGRSPAYPTLSLDKALTQLRSFREREGDYAAPLTSAFAAWGYSAKSSGGRQTLATLKYYGLIDILGEGDTRKIQISAIGRKILLDDREDQTERQANLRKVALSPAIHKTLFTEYPNGLASDSTMRHFLIFSEGYNDSAANDVIAEFRQTAEFVRLYDKSEKLENNQSSDALYKVGDCVNWESGGQTQWKAPWRINEIRKYSDGKFYYRMVGEGDDDGQEGWIPEDQAVSVEQTENPTQVEDEVRPLLALSIPNSQPNWSRSTIVNKEQVGIREEKASLDEGEVILRWPENLTAESVEDLEYWFAGIIRRAKRRAGMDDKGV